MTVEAAFKGSVVLITGASRGLGRAAARAFAKAGAHVVLVARTRGGLEEADDEVRALGGAATLVQMDLRDGTKVDALGPSLYQRFGRLDVLVANAGMLGPLTPVSHVKSEDWDQILGLNLTANWRLMRTLEPLLKLAPAGRAVLVTDSAARDSQSYWGPYAASKAGLEALARTWAAELVLTDVKVNLLDPGVLRTNLRGRAFPGEDPATQTDPDAVAPLLVELARPDLAATGKRYACAEGRLVETG